MHSVASSIIIDAPVQVCYETWMNFENFPQFMSHVNRVTQAGVNEHGDPLWHWEVTGPMGRTFGWTAAVVVQEPNKVISWTTNADEEIANSGTVNFLDMNKKQTLLEVKLTYSAPAAPFGELVADALHLGDGLVDQALREFKQHVERQHLGRVIQAEAITAPSGKKMLSEAGVMHDEKAVKRTTEAITRSDEANPPVRKGHGTIE